MQGMDGNSVAWRKVMAKRNHQECISIDKADNSKKRISAFSMIYHCDA
jgi:hypothetical protein